MSGISSEISEAFDLKGRFFSENRSFFHAVSWVMFDFRGTFAQFLLDFYSIFTHFFAVFTRFFAVFTRFFAIFIHFFAVFKDILTKNGIFWEHVLQKLT